MISAFLPTEGGSRTLDTHKKIPAGQWAGIMSDVNVIDADYLCITDGVGLALSYWLSTPSITLMI